MNDSNHSNQVAIKHLAWTIFLLDTSNAANVHRFRTRESNGLNAFSPCSSHEFMQAPAGQRYMTPSISTREDLEQCAFEMLRLNAGVTDTFGKSDADDLISAYINNDNHIVEAVEYIVFRMHESLMSTITEFLNEVKKMDMIAEMLEDNPDVAEKFGTEQNCAECEQRDTCWIAGHTLTKQ